jgi:hypothetical protein
MKPASFLLALSFLPFLGCGGDGNVLDLPKPVIHGQVAKIWKNGTELYSYGVSGSDTQAYGMALGGKDLHWVATRWSKTQSWVLLGRNKGTPVNLTNGTRPAEGYAVAVSGSNVYVGGFEATGGPATAPVPVAKVWVNGVGTSLTDGTREAKVNGLVVSNGQYYAAGYEFVAPAGGGAATKRATVWEGATPTRLTDGSTPAEAWAVAVDDNGGGLVTVYAGGWRDQGGNRVATVWMNGAARYTLGDPANQSVVTGLRVAGGDLYASGYEISNGVSVAKIWKNGVLYQALGDGTVPSTANGLDLAGGNPVAAGSRGPSATRAATFWVNGDVRPALTDGTSVADGTAVLADGTDVYVAGYLTMP